MYVQKTALLRSGRINQSAHPAPPWTPLPCHNVPHCTSKHYAARIECCTMRVQTLGGVWECLEVIPARYFVWGPSEGWTESEGVKSQLGPKVPQNTPQTPPNAHVCFMWCIYMLCEVVGCLWCALWTVHGPEIPICDPGVESRIHPDQGHLVKKNGPPV